MKVLLLGGNADGRRLAYGLHRKGHDVIYSVAESGARQLPCEIRSGRFGDADSLAAYMKEKAVEWIVDATHPYASVIQWQAWHASRQLALPLWRFQRPSWTPGPGDQWLKAEHLEHAVDAVAGFRRPLFTVGSGVLAYVDRIPPGQFWVIRCLSAPCRQSRYEVMHARGPFTLEQEKQWFRRWEIDVLVCKNSGAEAVAAKLTAARQARLPVVMLKRPHPPPAERCFDSLPTLEQAL